MQDRPGAPGDLDHLPRLLTLAHEQVGLPRSSLRLHDSRQRLGDGRAQANALPIGPHEPIRVCESLPTPRRSVGQRWIAQEGEQGAQSATVVIAQRGHGVRVPRRELGEGLGEQVVARIEAAVAGFPVIARVRHGQRARRPFRGQLGLRAAALLLVEGRRCGERDQQQVGHVASGILWAELCPRGAPRGPRRGVILLIDGELDQAQPTLGSPGCVRMVGEGALERCAVAGLFGVGQERIEGMHAGGRALSIDRREAIGDAPVPPARLDGPLPGGRLWVAGVLLPRQTHELRRAPRAALPLDARGHLGIPPGSQGRTAESTPATRTRTSAVLGRVRIPAA